MLPILVFLLTFCQLECKIRNQYVGVYIYFYERSNKARKKRQIFYKKEYGFKDDNIFFNSQKKVNKFYIERSTD